MKRRTIVILACAGALAVGIAGLFALAATSEFTECYGGFRSVGSAEAAAADAEDVGFDARVDRRARGAVVYFENGETGDDAAGFRSAFHEVLGRHDGLPGHPGGGCVERPHFD